MYIRVFIYSVFVFSVLRGWGFWVSSVRRSVSGTVAWSIGMGLGEGKSKF